MCISPKVTFRTILLFCGNKTNVSLHFHAKLKFLANKLKPAKHSVSVKLHKHVYVCLVDNFCLCWTQWSPWETLMRPQRQEVCSGHSADSRSFTLVSIKTRAMHAWTTETIACDGKLLKMFWFFTLNERVNFIHHLTRIYVDVKGCCSYFHSAVGLWKKSTMKEFV